MSVTCARTERNTPREKSFSEVWRQTRTLDQEKWCVLRQGGMRTNEQESTSKKLTKIISTRRRFTKVTKNHADELKIHKSGAEELENHKSLAYELEILKS